MATLLTALVRIGLPAAIGAVGLGVLGFGHGDTATGVGGSLIGVAVIVAFANLLFRLGLHSDADRDAEERAREVMARTGRWPAD